mgnify:CR=1 FL=1
MYKRLKWSDIPRIIAKNARQTGTILFIAIAAKPAGQIFELDGLPTKLAHFVLGISDNQLVIMFALFIFLIIVGSSWTPPPPSTSWSPSCSLW